LGSEFDPDIVVVAALFEPIFIVGFLDRQHLNRATYEFASKVCFVNAGSALPRALREEKNVATMPMMQIV